MTNIYKTIGTKLQIYLSNIKNIIKFYFKLHPLIEFFVIKLSVVYNTIAEVKNAQVNSARVCNILLIRSTFNLI